jgi:hypothetical protein
MKPTKFDAVGVRVRLFLDDDGEWHAGMVEEYHPRRGYHIQLFDGQDLWVEKLDDNVEFEKELDLGYTTQTAEKAMETQMSFHDDELAFLQDTEDVLQTDVPDENEEFGRDMEVPDYRAHQDYNQRAIRVDLPTLPARGVLLSGSVLGAAGLTTDVEDPDGEIFFKVLFVEGGSQPAMFRCKTPIFTSSPVPNSLANPRWNGARFHFDMIMPVDAAQDVRSPYGFKIQGEIIIAVYMSRSSGGNSLLGQTSFQLRDIVETGTVEYFSSGYEGRSVTGAHTILSRSGDISGEIDVQLNIAWKSLRTDLGASVTASQSKLGLPPRPASAAATRAGSAPRGGASRAPGSARDGSAPRARPASAVASKGGVAPPRKIVSNIQRKQREDAARIAKENKKLQHTLEQHANRGGRSSGVPVNSAYAAGGAASAPSAAASAARPASATMSGANSRPLSRTAEAKEPAPSRGGAASKATSDVATLEALLRMYTELKRSTGADEQETVRLRLKVGKLKVSVKQAEMSVERIRSEGKSTAGAAGLRNSLRNSGESGLRGRESAAALPKDCPLPSARSQAKDDVAQVARTGAHTYVPFFAPLTEPQLRGLGVLDGEYTSLAEEYTVLQNVRRGLLDRLATAKATCDTASEKQLSSRERLEMIRRRVDYYRNIAGKLAIGVTLQLEDGGALGAKRTAPVAEDLQHDDYVLFDRLREGKQEYVTECALYESGMHTVAQDNALEELRAVRDLLAGKCTAVEASVRQLKQDNDEVHRQLREAMSAQRELDVDAYIRQLRAARGAHGRRGSLSAAAEDRLKVASDGLAAVDRQLKGVKERQQERRHSKSGPTAAAQKMVLLDD